MAGASCRGVILTIRFVVLAACATLPALGMAQEFGSFSEQVARQGYDNLHDIHFRLHHEGGEMAGQPRPYTLFGAFAPFRRYNGLAFVDGQLVMDNDGEVSGNVGVGRRWYHAETDSILGASLWYDLDRTRRKNEFHQMGVGLEWLFYRWDFRANVYAPLGDRVKGTGATVGTTDIRFEGNHLVYGSRAIYDTSLGGVDLEIARRIADLNLWAFGGTYHYDGPGLSTWGAKGGLRGYLTETVAASLTLSDDSLFKTNLAFGITWFFPTGNRRGSSPASNRGRLYLPVQRNDYIVVHETLGDALTILTDGGTPITITHVNDDGEGTGAGTFEDPFGSLTDAAGSTSDIVYIYADSVFDGQSYAMAANQRLLGEADGYDHQLQTDQFGMITLPRATAGINRPVIQNAFPPGSFGSAISTAAFAANVEVSALVIDSPGPESGGVPGPNAIHIGGLGDVNINRVDIANSEAIALSLQNITGDVTVDEVSITNTHLSNPGSSVSAVYIGNVTGNVSLTNTTVDDADDGISFHGITGDALAANNTVSNITKNTGIWCREVEGRVHLTGNTITNTHYRGIMLESIDATYTLWDVRNNTLSGSDNGAFEASTDAGFSGAVEMNLIGNTADLDYELNHAGGGTFQFYNGGQVSGNVINNGATEVFTPF